MSRWMTGVAVGVTMLVLAVGCGGGGDSSTEVTKAEFTKQANAICAEERKKRDDAYANYSKEVRARVNGVAVPKLERALANKMIDETVVPSLESQLGQLEKLEAPAAEEAKISKMLRTLSKATVELEKGGIRKLVIGGKLTTFQEEAEGYGLDCSIYTL